MFTVKDGIIWEADAQTFKFSRVEGSVTKILGYNSEEWLSQPDFWQTKLHPDDAERVLKSWRDIRQNGLPFKLTYRMIAADGRSVWVQDNLALSQSGDRASLSGQMIDVSEFVEQAQSSAALNGRSGYSRALYDLVPVAIWEEDWVGVLELLRSLRAQGVLDIHAYARQNRGFVADALSRLHVLSVNCAAVDMFGAANPEDLIRRASEVFRADQPNSVFLMALNSILRGDRNIEGVNTLRRLDGNEFQVMFRIALPDIEDRAARIFICELDISAVHIANERLELLTRATSDVIWDYDFEQETIWASDGLKRIFGLDPEAMSCSIAKWIERIHPDDMLSVMSHVDNLLHKGQNEWDQEYRFMRGDGSYAFVRNDGFIQRDGTGRAIRMVGSLVDISEQHLLKEQLMQSQKLEALGKLTGGIAHDFNNLLTVMLGSLEALKDGAADDVRAQRHINDAIHAIDRSTQLISQLLSYARQQPMTPQALDMERLVRDMMGMIELALGASITVKLQTDPGLWRCRADPAQFENALLNLCINARDAMPYGGHLTIRMRNSVVRERDLLAKQGLEPGQYVVLSVADTGHGMNAATLRAAFDPFFTTKEVGQGSGLGLSMVQGFAQQSHGLASIHSEAGKGTVVIIHLPMADTEIQAEAQTSHKPDFAQASAGRILLVEDQDIVREHVVSILEGLGYSVLPTATAIAATEILRGDHNLDLVLTDIVLPGVVSGLTLAERVRKLKPDLPVVFMSGFAELDPDAVVHLTVGKNLLHKPFRRKELIDFVRQAIASRKQS